MEQLFEFFKALALIAGILFLLLVILAIVMVFVNKITYKKRLEKAKNDFYKNLNELGDILAKVDIKEEKPKKKTTRTKKNVKEDK